jgi:hypothetical protein
LKQAEQCKQQERYDDPDGKITELIQLTLKSPVLAKMAARAINPIFNCNIGWDETNSKHGTIVNGV